MRSRARENAVLSTRELREKKTLLLSRPRQINVALTTRCNIDCRMCEVKKWKWEVPERTVAEIEALFPVLERVVWQGGEVFLYGGFRDILAQAAPYPELRHEITTNAHLLDERWIDLLGRLTVDLNISVDAVEKEAYEYIRRGSSFGNIVKNLELLNAGTMRGSRVMIVTIMKSNYDKLEGFAAFASRYGFNRIIVQPVKANDDSDENIFRSGDRSILSRLSENVNRLKSETERAGIEFVHCLPLPGPRNAPESVKCSGGAAPSGTGAGKRSPEPFCCAPWQQLFIEWGGFVYPHCLCICDGTNEERHAGNVLKNSLEEIWNGPRMMEYRQRILDNAYQGLCNPDCINGTIPGDMRSLCLRDEER